MTTTNDDTAWKLGVQQLIRRMIADLYFSPEKEQFQRQLDGLLSTTLATIETVQFPGVADATSSSIKASASATVRQIVGTIKPA